MFFVSCRVLNYIVICLYVSCNRSIYSVGDERANLSFIVYLYVCGFCSERFPFPLGAWGDMRYFIVTFHGPSIEFFTFLIYHN